MSVITDGSDLINLVNITEEGRGGGALYRIVSVSNALKDNVKTIIAYPKDSDWFKKQINSVQLEGYELSLHHLGKSYSQIVQYLAFFIPEIYALKKLIKSKNADLVHCNGSWQLKGILASRLAGVKSVWHMNDSYQPFLVRCLFRLFSGWASSYIFASIHTKEYYTSISPDILQKPYSIIPAPVDPEQFKPTPHQPPSLNSSTIKVLTVGYVNRNKGLDILLDAVSIINSSSTKNVDFIIAGPILDSQKEYFEYLQMKITDLKLGNIQFIGYREDISVLLNECDLYICASRFESSPIAVWEALACGCYVISSKVGDIEKIFSEYNCGVLFETGDPRDLADKILAFLNGQMPVDDIKSLARETALKRFSIDSISFQYLAFYRDILNDG